MADSKIIVETAGGISRITLSNPAKLNSISAGMLDQLNETLIRLEDDPDLRLLVLTGEGERAFSSGADVSGFDDPESRARARCAYEGGAELALARLLRFPRPTVAMIRGYCMGGGVSLAALCDLRIAEAGAVFSVAAAKLGLGYSYFGTQRLVSLVGATTAKEMLFTALRYSAEDALRLGLVSRVFPKDSFTEDAEAYLAAIAVNAPLTIRAAKMAADTPPEDELSPVLAAIAACGESGDFAEGRKAFSEKRKPVFQGR
ncbi:enoyl-CoA hydratase [Paracoccus saliphilus]|uniref:Enoyl-CoA hydratase/carnithine racemase n=1 Tax=Paracoccus saliphilus TaxID=405559 RepID=A0AA45W674_9RHOB|nr:enoyl-CoA hydratase [Paracoccus saliphilus]WCR01530.1 enoyl-CoA hydratase/isomerase family protein [Paracoccus saliphilus]SIS99202.1 Enoyl-CoA hydratase/carnithine racemase [Paracoccus saliphilus]